MPGLNLISGPGDQQTPTDSFVSNFLKGVQLPGQLQSQKLQNQMLQQHMDFQAQMQPLQMQKAQTDLQTAQAMNPVQIELLKSEVAKNDQMVKYYQSTEGHLKAADAAEQQRIDIARATAAAQVTAANTDNWVKLATLPGALEENRAKVDLMHSEVGQTQAHTAALTAGIGLQGRQQDLAEQQFAQQALTQSMSTLASLSTNYGPAMGQKYAGADPILNHIFNSTNPVPPIQPQTAQGVLNQRLAPMLANAPAETIAEYGDLALKGTTAAQQFSGNMLGMGQNAGQSGLIQGSKIADNARANASAAAQSIYSLKTSRPGSGESSPPPGTVAPGQATQATNPDAQGVMSGIANPAAAVDLFGSVDYHAQSHPTAGLQPYDSKRGYDFFKKSGVPDPIEADYTQYSRSKFKNVPAGMDKDSFTAFHDANEIDPTGVPAVQVVRYQALLNAMYQAKKSGGDPISVMAQFSQRYNPASFDPKLQKAIGDLRTALSE